jgi:hypothetical protein
MPTYEFRNTSTGEIEEHIMKIAELDQFKLDNPHLERVMLTVPGCVDPITAGVRTPSSGFKDLLKHMKKKVGGNNTIKDY